MIEVLIMLLKSAMLVKISESSDWCKDIKDWEKSTCRELSLSEDLG